MVFDVQVVFFDSYPRNFRPSAGDDVVKLNVLFTGTDAGDGADHRVPDGLE